MQRDLPPVATDGRVAAGVMAWRYRGRLQLTIFAKATFALVPGGVAAHAGPGRIALEDATFGGNPTRSVEVSSDRVPYRERVDVLFTGHAHAPGGTPAPSGTVRLGLARGGRVLLEKVLLVYGDRAAGGAAPTPFTKLPVVYERALGGPGEANPVGTATPNFVDPKDPRRPSGLAPIARFWPARKALLGAAQRAALDGPVAELPDAMPWDYFQSAPPDQQVAAVQPGDWLVLDGVHAALPRLSTQLPEARAVARVAGVAVALVCDTIAVDGDKQVLTMVWRGRCDAPTTEGALADWKVQAALETAGAGVNWASVTASRVPAPAAPRGDAEGTMLAPEGAPPSSDAIAPFAIPGPGSSRAPASAAATPWADRAAPSARSPDVGESTIAQTAADHARLAHGVVAPFALATPGAPAAHAPTDATPWGSSPPRAPLRDVAAGDETVTVGSRAPVPPGPPPPPLPVVGAAPAAPAPAAAPQSGAAVAPTASRSSPLRRVAGPPAFHRAPAVAAPTRAKPERGTPEALAQRLGAAGAGDDDVSALLDALKPPPPPPPPSDD